MANNGNNKNSSFGIENEKTDSRQRGGGESRLEVEENERDQNFRALRCFCGCMTLTHEQIEHFAAMSISTLIVHRTGGKLFRNFLRIGHGMDKSEGMMLLECYDICDKVLRNRHLIHHSDCIDDLLSLCPSIMWEQRINDVIQNDPEHSMQRIVPILRDLKLECVHSIERHNDYDRFRRELLRKIGR